LGDLPANKSAEDGVEYFIPTSVPHQAFSAQERGHRKNWRNPHKTREQALSRNPSRRNWLQRPPEAGGIDLRRTCLSDVNVAGCDLSDADVPEATCREADPIDHDMTEAGLTGTLCRVRNEEQKWGSENRRWGHQVFKGARQAPGFIARFR
jgi:uncharacterized protein YjbI with pentapeptide repeats